MYFYHYFDRSIGPFRNLSDLTVSEAEAVLARIRQTRPGSMCAARQESYINDRLYYEEILRRRAAYAEQSELAQLRLSPAAAATYRVLTAMLPYLAEEAKDKLNALCEGSFVDAESMERLLLPLVHNEDRAIAIYYARLNGRTI